MRQQIKEETNTGHANYLRLRRYLRRIHSSLPKYDFSTPDAHLKASLASKERRLFIGGKTLVIRTTMHGPGLKASAKGPTRAS